MEPAPQKARMWWAKAAKLGNSEAKMSLEEN